MTTKTHSGTALVTGASTGIGSVYADRLARRGYDLILVARNKIKLDALASRITNETGRSVEVVAADLNDFTELARVENILRADASITLLVNSAGLGAVTSLLDSPVDKMDAMVTLNVVSLTRLTQAVIPAFAARKKGIIINIGSIVGMYPELLNGIYGATKAYVQAYTQSLHHELKDRGITVQVVAPGATATPFWDLAGSPVENFPPEIVMTTENLVDAALAGLDLGEVVTVPSLPDVADWNAYEDARVAMFPNLSKKAPAARYGIA